MPEVNVLHVGVEANAEGVRRVFDVAPSKLEDALQSMARGMTGALKMTVTPGEMRKLVPALEKIQEAIRKALATAIDQTTAAVVEGAQGRVPVDTGRLKYSIRAVDSKTTGDSVKAQVTAGGDAKRSRWVSSKTGLNVTGNVVAYAAAVEFGLPETPAYPTQPFMFPAAESQRGPYVDRAKEAVESAVRSAAQ